MRRGFQVWQDGNGDFHPEPVEGSTAQFAIMPHKQALIDGLNGLNATQSFACTQTDPGATFPCYDSSGGTTDCPGTVIPPGAYFVNAGPFSTLFAALFLVRFDYSYNSEEDGDGPGAIINADGSRSTTKGNFSGAAGLIAFLQSWLKLAQYYFDKKDYKRAGELTYAYHEVITGAWSITRAIDYLTRARVF